MGDQARCQNRLQTPPGAAQKGHSVAQFSVGSMYATGKGTKRDDTKAFEWFQTASQGHIPAQFNLGLAYDKGLGTKNLELALNWYDKAAKQGHPKAQNNLGLVYHNSQAPLRDTTLPLFGMPKQLIKGFPTPKTIWEFFMPLEVG